MKTTKIKKDVRSRQNELIPKWNFKINRNATALLIIDMQNDFMHPDGFYGKRREDWGYDFELRYKAIACTKRLANAMRKLNIPVIYCQTMWEQDYSDVGIPLQMVPGAKESKFLVRNSWGAQILDQLKPQKGDYIVVAKCFSKFAYTPLDLILRNNGMKTLIFTGVGSFICVESTLRNAVDLGFQCIMTSDGTAAKDRPLHEATLQRIHSFLGMVMTCEEVLELLNKSK